ncbi:MAG: hypothetical protein ACLQF1_20200 [Methyloceanibacter sp.]|jgi:hypothetical protein
MTDGTGNLVTLRDIDVPFWRIVMILVKWSIASIPAMIILALLWLVGLAVFVGIFGTHMPHMPTTPTP